MLKCPYCFEVVTEKVRRCPNCLQFVIDSFVESDYKSIEKKRCIFCGKKIVKEARICKHCRRWLDDVGRIVDDIEESE